MMTQKNTLIDHSVGHARKLLKKAHLKQKKLRDKLKKYWRIHLEKLADRKRVDISVPEASVNIEVDGVQHSSTTTQALADLKRTYYSFKRGWVTLRIPNCLVKDSKVLGETVDFINEFLKVSQKRQTKKIDK